MEENEIMIPEKKELETEAPLLEDSYDRCYIIRRSKLAPVIRTVPMGALNTNCYIIYRPGKKGAVVIDPGDDVPKLIKELNRLNLIPEYVLLTHGHYDHILGAAHLEKKYCARVRISLVDSPCLHNTVKNLKPSITKCPFIPTVASGYLEAGSVCAGSFTFTLLPTPGHTAGSVSLILKGANALFTGDTLFAHGYGRTDLPTGNINALVSSLRLLLRQDENLYVYPGHGEGCTLKSIKRGYLI